MAYGIWLGDFTILGLRARSLGVLGLVTVRCWASCRTSPKVGPGCIGSHGYRNDAGWSSLVCIMRPKIILILNPTLRPKPNAWSACQLDIRCLSYLDPGFRVQGGLGFRSKAF